MIETIYRVSAKGGPCDGEFLRFKDEMPEVGHRVTYYDEDSPSIHYFYEFTGDELRFIASEKVEAPCN
jgi:hypothetical protein